MVFRVGRQVRRTRWVCRSRSPRRCVARWTPWWRLQPGRPTHSAGRTITRSTTWVWMAGGGAWRRTGGCPPTSTPPSPGSTRWTAPLSSREISTGSSHLIRSVTSRRWFQVGSRTMNKSMMSIKWFSPRISKRHFCLAGSSLLWYRCGFPVGEEQEHLLFQGFAVLEVRHWGQGDGSRLPPPYLRQLGRGAQQSRRRSRLQRKNLLLQGSFQTSSRVFSFLLRQAWSCCGTSCRIPQNTHYLLCVIRQELPKTFLPDIVLYSW